MKWEINWGMILIPIAIVLIGIFWLIINQINYLKSQEQRLMNGDMKFLYLNIKKDPFEAMISGEKSNEYRKPNEWIKSRLFNPDGTKKKIDFIKFIWGYGADRPYFIVECKFFFESERNFTMEYSNGLKVKVKKGDYIIKFGKILSSSEKIENTLF